jgi:hypothetical protein
MLFLSRECVAINQLVDYKMSEQVGRAGGGGDGVGGRAAAAAAG